MAYKSRKRKSDLDPTPPRKEQRLLIRSLVCSNCYTDFQVEAITKNLTAECYDCPLKPNTDICGGYPFEMVDDETQLAQNFQCPICLLILRNTTELPCNHLMCAKCLIRNEGILSRALPDLR